MQEADDPAYLGLPWPDSYKELLPVLQEFWGVEGGLYLNRKLSGGRSGALVYAADIESEQFTGQAILKLDQAPDPASREEDEADRHRQAIEDAPDFAARHLPRLLHTLHYKEQIAVLSTIAGRGLEYAKPWSDCPFEKQLQMVRQVSRGVLEDWNHDYKRQRGLRPPQALLQSWLTHRLHPEQGGRIHSFLSERCGLTPEEPTIMFEGNWYPNPLAFALGVRALPDRLRLRMATGHCHGDLHGLNVLVGRPESPEPDYYLIDLAFYQSEQYLFYDHAYFELAHLLNSRMGISASEWQSVLERISRASSGGDTSGLRSDDIGHIELVMALRQEVSEWIDRHEGDRLSFMERQYLLARVAAGLNFTHKTIPDEMRRKAFIYAASNLKDYVKLNQLDWPKHGPAFLLEQSVRTPDSGSATEASPPLEAEEQPVAAMARPDKAPRKPEEQADEPRPRTVSFLQELGRRHVIKIAGLYLVVAWLCVQVAGALKPALGLPPWTDSLVTLLLALGFPIACIIAWAFELSPSGLQRTQPAERSGKSSLRGLSFVDYVVVLGMVGLLGFTLWREGFDYFRDGPDANLRGGGPPSIAVLPFRNLSENGADDTFSDGLTIEIMATLARTGQFRIPGQTSTFKYKDQSEDLRTIGEDLGVEFLLEGSVRRVGDDLRVEAQLIEADDGFLVWSDAFSDKLEDIFVIQEKIANAIGAALKTPLGVEASGLQTGRTESLRAYELFLSALSLVGYQGPGINTQIADGIELLNKSVEVDPDFAAGWAALSLAYGFGVVFPPEIDGRTPAPAAYIRRAAAAAVKARKLNPNLPIVNHAMADVHRRSRQWSSAEDLYRRALELEPNDALAMLDYAKHLTIVGHNDQAIAMTEKVGEIDPHNPLLGFMEALLAWQTNPTAANAEAFIGRFGSQPGFDPLILRSTMGYFVDSDQVDRLRTLLQDCTKCEPAWRDTALAMVDAVGTESPEAIFDTYKDSRVIGYSFLDAIGGPDLVLKAFKHFADDQAFRFEYYLVPWTELDQVGKTEEFQQLIGDVGLVEYWRERGWPERCRPLEGSQFECG